MAKDLPYFKFIISEWNDGDVTLCSLEAQGLFINLCSLYWSQEGELSLSKSKRRFSGCNATAWKELISDKVIKIDGDNIVINFLDEQFEDRGKLSVTNSKNATDGWKKRRENATAQRPHTEPIEVVSNKEEKREEEKRKKEKRTEENDPLRAIGVLPFESEEFVNAWLEWEKFRKELGKKLTPSTAKKQMQFLGGWTEPQAIGILNQSITNGWTGLFQLKVQVNGTSKTTKSEQSNATGDYLKQHYGSKINGQ